MGTLWWAELVQWLPPVLGDHFISEYVARVADIVIDYADLVQLYGTLVGYGKNAGPRIGCVTVTHYTT